MFKSASAADCHVYGEDSNEERGRKHCKFANHCRYAAKTEGREKHGCYWKGCAAVHRCVLRRDGLRPRA
jgi:hypothetical protein